MITTEMNKLIEEFGVGAVATISKQGKPKVSPKGTFRIWSDEELVFANIRSPKTVANLQANPSIEVCFTDIFQRTACRVCGTARYFEKGTAEFGIYFQTFENKWPSLAPLFRGFVSISVEQAQLVKSPSYDVGLEAAELDRNWLEHYQKLISNRSS